MSPTFVSILCAIASMATAACLISPLVLLAYRKNLVDKPNIRKLQHRPVPVLGGVSLIFSISCTLLLCLVFLPGYVAAPQLTVACLATLVIFAVGLYDDLITLSFRVKFVFQILVITLLWYAGFGIDSFAGLFGVWHMNTPLSLLFSLVVGVGLINAINMLDGVDGLSSSFGIITGIVVAAFFLLHGYSAGGCVGCMVAGALVPFFICNVFSKKYKMFIGDSGSMAIGVLAYLAVCITIHLPQSYALDDYRVSWLMAVYAVPVYDTLRVMFGRMLHGQSPFLPDKTHLHHAFVELQFPHLMITLMELSLVVLILLLWIVLAALCLWLNISAEWNAVMNIVIDMSIVTGSYFYVQYLKFHSPESFARHIADGHRAGRRIDKPVSFIRNMIDGKDSLPHPNS